MLVQDSFLKRLVSGALVGALVGIACILVGVVRGLFVMLGGGHIAPLTHEEVRLLSFYVAGFIVAGIILSAIWPSLNNRVAKYFGFSLAGIVAMIGVLAGDKGGIAARDLFDWVLAVSIGIFLGCAFAVGWFRASGE